MATISKSKDEVTNAMTTWQGFAQKYPDARVWGLVLTAGVVWLIAWTQLKGLADGLIYGVLGLSQGSHLGESVAFFLYDVPKILLLK